MKTIFKTLIFSLILNFAFAAPSQEELKKMSVFISNFSEISLKDIDISLLEDENYFLEELKENPQDKYIEYTQNSLKKIEKIKNQLVYFGIWHNYANNSEKRIYNSSCPKKTNYAGIENKYIKESVDKFFGYKLSDSDLAKSKLDGDYKIENNCYYFQIADGVPPMAKVNFTKQVEDKIFMQGDIYILDAKNKKENIGSFIANARIKTWEGKKTWELISYKTIYYKSGE